MKDEHDTRTIDLVEASTTGGARPLGRGTAGGVAELKLPADAKPMLTFNGWVHLVPVSFVAKDWKVSPRRIRALLAVGRLQGHQQENGYWEVAYPYRFTFGTRGPSLQRSQKALKQPQKPELRVV